MPEISPKGSGTPLSKSEACGLILKQSSWRISSKLVCTFKFKLFLWGKISVYNKNRKQVSLKIGLDLSNSKQLLTYKNRQQTFFKTIKEKGIEYFKVAKVWLIPENNDSLENYLLQLHTSSVTKEKYEIVKKQLKEEKDPNIVFQAFCILEDNNKGTYKIGSYKTVPKINDSLSSWLCTYIKEIKSQNKWNEWILNKIS